MRDVETLERMAQVITLQSCAICELYKILLQYTTAAELDGLSCMERLRGAAEALDSTPETRETEVKPWFPEI